MTDKPMAVVFGRPKHNTPPPPEGCPITAMIKRGRKGAARDGELMTAERTALGYTRKRPTGIYRKVQA